MAHNGAIVPVPGRDLFVQAWYQGGVSIIDFTDSSRPFEIAYFDRGPIDAEELVTGGYWSTYWYDGLIYGTEIIRGLDVFELLPSEYLSENEIAASNVADQGAVFNPQQQLAITWPAHPQIALAYMDQFQRAGRAVAGDTELREVLQNADSQMSSGMGNPLLGRQILELADAIDTKSIRLQPLKEVLVGIGVALRR